ncbi:hypothetical protein MMC30_004372 [Trapelia coarctata]|nr:hypothetical protein [Trapelia coarctata]
MKVIIVGAGIGGLSAGIGLRRAGHDVLILERSSLAHEIGAAIHVPPNASRVLLQWGFNPERAMLDRTRVAGNFDAKTLEAGSFRMEMGFVPAKYGYPWFLSHRVDLHNELKLLATSKDGLGTPVEIRTSSNVTTVDPENGIVTLQDSTTLSAHLIIAADGVHSASVAVVIGQPNPATPTGHSAFRFLIPTDAILEDPETRDFIKEEGSMKIFIGEGKRIVWYPCRRKAKDIKLWPLLTRNPLPTWHRSRLVLIGDAAHPMLPHQGQGGAQAIEDGAALGHIFASNSLPVNPSAATIIQRLALFETVRKDRASIMQIFSSVAQDEAHLMHDKAKAYIKEGQEVPRTQQDFFNFNFGYDVFGHCDEVMAKAGARVGEGENGVADEISATNDEVPHPHAEENTTEANQDGNYNLTAALGSDASRTEEEALALAAAAAGDAADDKDEDYDGFVAVAREKVTGWAYLVRHWWESVYVFL